MKLKKRLVYVYLFPAKRRNSAVASDLPTNLLSRGPQGVCELEGKLVVLAIEIVAEQGPSK